MFDAEKLIEYVKENTPLWDRNHEYYGDKSKRENCWNNVGRNMYADTWNNLDEEKRQEKVIELKLKWRHIRDSYMKFVNRQVNGNLAPKRRKYVFADILTFLLQNFHQKRTRKENKIKQEDESSVSQEEDDIFEAEPLNDSSEPQPEYNPLEVPVFKAPTVCQLGNIEKELMNEQQFSEIKVDEDADRSFLLSLLPDLKRLNDDEKLDFRISALQFFRKIKRRKTQSESKKRFLSHKHSNNSQVHFQENHKPNSNSFISSHSEDSESSDDDN